MPTDWVVTTGNSTYVYPNTFQGGGGSYATTVVFGGAGLVAAPPPKTALEWLDDETEAVCKLARAA